jgi:hypothetical protein
MQELSPQERQRIYLEEKFRIEARQQITQEQKSYGQLDPASQKRMSKLGCLFGFFCIGGFLFLSNLPKSHQPFKSGFGLDATRESSTLSSAERSDTERHYLDSGSSDGLVMVFKSEGALDSASKSAAFKDIVGFRQVVSSGQAFFVSNGTHVITLEASLGGSYAVRIQDGPHKDEKVYANIDYVK